LRRYRPACFFLIFLFESVLLAQHGAEGAGAEAAGNSSELLWKWANFALLAGGLGYLVYRKAGGFFRSRTEAIRQGIEEADRLRREAEARVAEMDGRLKNLEAEIESLRHHAGGEMAAENERIRRETEESLRKMREQAEQEIASAAKAARHEVRAQAAELAVGLAVGKIRARLTPQTDQALVLSILEDLEHGPGADSGKELN
jgi:F-type H+-transporting ATPase subunit b